MALIRCPECNSKVSPNATICPVCNEPDPSRREKKGYIFRSIIALLMIAGAVGNFWFAVLPEIREHGLIHQMGQHQ